MTKDNENAAILLLKGVPIAMANAIRRTVLSNIPVWAIDDVKISTNTGPLHCEYVSHRLSLIPVEQPFASSASDYGGGGGGVGDYGGVGGYGDYGGVGGGEDDYGPFSSGGAATAEPEPDYSPQDYKTLSEATYENLTFHIKVKTTQDKIVEVTTKDITTIPATSDGAALCKKIFKEEFLITKLKGKDGAFECTFKIVQDTASKHAKWQAVNTIAYRYLIPGTDNADDVRQIKYDTVSLVQEQQSAQSEPQGFVFYIEKASLPISLVLQKALDHIAQTVTVFKTFLATTKPEKCWHDGMLEIEYESNETHTLGNLLATYGLLQHPGAFIGYRIIHPMIKKFILRFKIQKGEEEEEEKEEEEEEEGGAFEAHKMALGAICDRIIQTAQRLKLAI